MKPIAIDCRCVYVLWFHRSTTVRAQVWSVRVWMKCKHVHVNVVYILCCVISNQLLLITIFTFIRYFFPICRSSSISQSNSFQLIDATRLTKITIFVPFHVVQVICSFGIWNSLYNTMVIVLCSILLRNVSFDFEFYIIENWIIFRSEFIGNNFPFFFYQKVV